MPAANGCRPDWWRSVSEGRSGWGYMRSGQSGCVRSMGGRSLVPRLDRSKQVGRLAGLWADGLAALCKVVTFETQFAATRLQEAVLVSEEVDFVRGIVEYFRSEAGDGLPVSWCAGFGDGIALIEKAFVYGHVFRMWFLT